jgi:hypothetical protein
MIVKKAVTLLSSAARTATNTTAIQTDREHRGVRLFLNVTANPGGAETLTVSLNMVDPITGGAAGGVTRAITAWPATTAATSATYVYELYPGAVETAATANHEVQGGTLPIFYSVTVTHSASGSWTYALAADLIP